MSNAAAPSTTAMPSTPVSERCRVVLRWLQIVFACAAIAIAVGWTAFQLQRQNVLPAFFFPLLFPLLVGAAAGWACAAVFGALGQRNRIVLAVLTAIVATGIVAVEIGCGYRFYLTEIDASFNNHPETMLFRSNEMNAQLKSFGRFVATQRDHIVLWWIGDAVLTVMGGLLTMLVVRHRAPDIGNGNPSITKS